MRKYDRNQVTRCYDLAAKEYAKTFLRELEGKALDRWLLERFAHSVAMSDTIYDVGCGSGQTTRFVHDLGRTGVVGLDLSAQIIETARQSHPGVAFEVDDMLASQFSDASAAGITAFYAIVHFAYSDIETVVDEWRRLLRPGGRLLFSFHVGTKSVTVPDFLGVKGAKATWNFFNPGRVIAIVQAKGFSLDEALVRFPYGGAEHPSQRCYVLATRAP